MHRNMSAEQVYLCWHAPATAAVGMCAADKQEVRQRLNLRWGVIPFRMDFSDNPEQNIQKTFSLLKRREMVGDGDLVIVVSDLKPDDGSVVRSIQVRRVPNKPDKHH